MSDMLLDPLTKDVNISGGNVTLTQGKDAIAQHLGQRLQVWIGEYFLDRRRGIPYVQQVLVKNPNPTVLDAIFKSEIIQTPGVTQLRDFDLFLSEDGNRALSLNFKTDSIDGPIDYSQVLGALP